MLELILASLIPTAAIIIGMIFINRKIPILIQNVLDDVGEQLQEMFANPTIKKAYSILGKQSGEVRTDNALREKAANAIVQEIPSVNIILERLGIEPIEGIKLMNDPIFAPIIQGFIQKAAKMKGKGLSGEPRQLNVM